MFKKVLLFVIAVVIVAQFFSPDKNNGDISSVDNFIADTNPPDEVKDILMNNCVDCHSDHTRYPWYNSITPVNYWINNHVVEGKSHFNVSKWADYSDKKKDHKMEELIEEVKEKKMPLPSYTWTHHEADLTHDQIQEIVNWAELVRFKYSMSPKPQ